MMLILVMKGRKLSQPKHYSKVVQPMPLVSSSLYAGTERNKHHWPWLTCRPLGIHCQSQHRVQWRPLSVYLTVTPAILHATHHWQFDIDKDYKSHILNTLADMIYKPGCLFQTRVFGFRKLQTRVSGSGLPMTDGRATLWAWQQSSLSRHLTVDRSCLFSVAKLLFMCNSVVITPTITNWTPESDWKHKKTSSINCKLQIKADWKSIFPVSYSYRLWSLIWKNYKSLSLNLHEKAWVWIFKILSQKSSI